MGIPSSNPCFFPVNYYANPHSSHPRLNEEFPPLASGTKLLTLEGGKKSAKERELLDLYNRSEKKEGECVKAV